MRCKPFLAIFSCLFAGVVAHAAEKEKPSLILKQAPATKSADPSLAAVPTPGGTPPLDTLTSPDAEKLFQQSLHKLCSQVNGSTNAKMPFISECGPWPGMQVPAASLLGLVLLGEGNTLTRGPHFGTLRKLAVYVRSAGPAPHESIDNYRTWVLSFAILFLCETNRVSPSDTDRKLIQEMVTKLEGGAYADGGWGHTLEHERNSYGAFAAATIWATAALATAKEQGLDVDEKKLKRQFAWLRATLGGQTGGSFYSVKDRWMVSPGRTAGTIWALHRWDALDSAKQVEAGAAFVARHAKLTPEGHASGMMNFGWGALAAGKVGGDAAKEFWAAHVKSIYAARRADGSFAPQPWRDLVIFDQQGAPAFVQKQLKPTSDDRAGDGWAGVWMLTSWQAAREKSVLCGKRVVVKDNAAAPKTPNRPADK